MDEMGMEEIGMEEMEMKEMEMEEMEMEKMEMEEMEMEKMEMEEMEMEEMEMEGMEMVMEEEMAITSEDLCLLGSGNIRIPESISHKRTNGIEAAYAMSWAKLMKLITEGYCPRNEGDVITAEPTKLQDTIRIANNLMDQKLKGYARIAENKRRLDNNLRDTQGQQLVFKRQNVRGQNVARAYTAGNNEKKGYVGSLPYCNKCKLHHAGPCTVRCGNCKRVGHITRDCTTTVTPNTQRTLVRSQSGITRNKNGIKNGNQTRGNEAMAKAYAIGGGGANLDSNVVTGMFLLNNRYASMLFDLGADRSFMSSTFSALLDEAPSTLDTSYVVELADRRILETNVLLRGCTLGLLGYPFDIDLMPIELGSFDVII
ncbi:putative reverse transcriptase domain-containing protein [Tanacetum coccineum]